MVLRIPKVSISVWFAIVPILFFNSCTFEFIKHHSFVLPIVLVCLVIWFVLMLNERFLSEMRILFTIALYSSILIVLYFFGGQKWIPVLMTNLTNILYMVFLFCMFIVYSGQKHKNDRRFIVFMWTIDTLIACLYSIYRLIDEPNLSRLLSTGSYHQTSQSINARGIVSFGVIYGLVLVSIVLFWFVIPKNGKSLSKLLLITVFSTLLIFAQFTIAILMLILGYAIVLLTNDLTKKNMVSRSIIMIFVCLISVLILPYVLDFVVKSDALGYEINARIKEIQLFISGGNLKETDMLIRFSQYIMSLSAFFSSYGFGKVFFKKISVGTHSEWFDGLGNYGLVYIIYIVGIVRLYKYVSEIMPNQKAKSLYRIVFIVYVLMSLVNTSTWAPIMLDLLVVIPFICIDEVKPYEV